MPEFPISEKTIPLSLLHYLAAGDNFLPSLRQLLNLKDRADLELLRELYGTEGLKKAEKDPNKTLTLVEIEVQIKAETNRRLRAQQHREIVKNTAFKQKTLSKYQFGLELSNILRELVANAVDATLLDLDQTIGQFGAGGSLGPLALIGKKGRLVALNKEENQETSQIVIFHKGGLIVDLQSKIDLGQNCPPNTTLIALYLDQKYQTALQEIRQKALEISQLEVLDCFEVFKFLELVSITLEVYDDSGFLAKSQTINSSVNSQFTQTNSSVKVRFFSDRLEVLNSKIKDFHPLEIYTGKSSKPEKKQTQISLESHLEDPENPQIYFLGQGRLIVEKAPLCGFGNELTNPLSLTSVKVSLPLSVDISRNAAVLEMKTLLSNWQKVLSELPVKYEDKTEVLKIFNSLKLFIDNLSVIDTKAVLKEQCLTLLIKEGRELVKTIQAENPDLLVLPNLKIFARIQTNEQEAVLADVDFLENYSPEKLPESTKMDSILIENSRIPVWGVDFQWEEVRNLGQFIVLIKKTQQKPETFFQENDLPFLSLKNSQNAREVSQIWLPAVWIREINIQAAQLSQLLEYQFLRNLLQEQRPKSFKIEEEKESRLPFLAQLQVDFDQKVSLLQIICTPKTSYENNFCPAIIFKTSQKIKQEIETAHFLQRKEQKPESEANSKNNEIAIAKNELATRLQSLFPKPEMQGILKKIVEIIFNNPTSGLGELKQLKTLKGEYGDNSFKLGKIRLYNSTVYLDYSSAGKKLGFHNNNLDLIGKTKVDNLERIQGLNLHLLTKIDWIAEEFLALADKLPNLTYREYDKVFLITTLLNFEEALEESDSLELKSEFKRLKNILKEEIECLRGILNPQVLPKPDIVDFLSEKVINPEFYKPYYIGLLQQGWSRQEVWLVAPDFNLLSGQQPCFIALQKKDLSVEFLELDLLVDEPAKSLHSVLEDLFIKKNSLYVNLVNYFSFRNRESSKKYSPNLYQNDGVFLIDSVDNESKKIIYPQNNGDYEIKDSYGEGLNYITFCKASQDGDEIPVAVDYLNYLQIFYSTKDGFYFWHSDRDKNFSLRFLPVQKMLNYKKGDDAIRTTVLLEMDADKVVHPPKFSDQPFIVLQGNKEEEVVLNLGPLLKNFEEKYKESLKNDQLLAQLPTYEQQTLEPYLQEFNTFTDSLNLSAKEKENWWRFCQKGLFESKLDLKNTSQVGIEIVRKYFEQIRLLLPQFLACFETISISPEYNTKGKSKYSSSSDIYQNFDLLNNLLFSNEDIAKACQILESWQKLKSDKELLELVNSDSQEIFNILYQSFFICGDKSPAIFYSQYDEENFTTENLKYYLFFALHYSDYYSRTKESGEIKYKYSSIYQFLEPFFAQKAYHLLKALKKQVGYISDENFKAVLDAVDSIFEMRFEMKKNENLSIEAKIYEDYFQVPGNTFLPLREEEIKQKPEQSLSLAQQLAKLKMAQVGQEDNENNQTLLEFYTKSYQNFGQEILEAAHKQPSDLPTITKELFQNALDAVGKRLQTERKDYEPEIKFWREAVIGGGNFLEKEQVYFHFIVEDNALGVDILQLLSAFSGSKRQDGEQQGFFGLGFKTAFAQPGSVVCITTCRQDSQNKEAGKQYISCQMWLKFELDTQAGEKNLRLLDYQEKEEKSLTKSSFTKIDVYQPTSNPVPILEAIRFDQAIRHCTALLKDGEFKDKLKIYKDDQEMELEKYEAWSSNSFSYGNYNLEVSVYPQQKQLAPFLYLQNMPVMTLEKMLADLGLNQPVYNWLTALLKQIPIQFNFEMKKNLPKTHPLVLSRNDFTDPELKKMIFSQALAQIFSYLSSQLIEGDLSSLIADEALQSWHNRPDLFNPSRIDLNLINLAEKINTVNESNSLSQLETNWLELPENVSRLADLLVLINFPLQGGLGRANLWTIAKRYQEILKIPHLERTPAQAQFMTWLTGTSYGKQSKLVADEESAKSYIKNLNSRTTTEVKISQEERETLNYFEQMANKFLTDFNHLAGANFRQSFDYADNHGVAANWQVEIKQISGQISWTYDKQNLLRMKSNPKEMLDLFAHEFSHVLEDLMRDSLIGQEEENLATHGLEFINLMRLLALQVLAASF